MVSAEYNGAISLVVGWHDRASIHGLVARYRELFADLPWLLVSTLDSNRWLSPSVGAHLVEAPDGGHALAVPGSRFVGWAFESGHNLVGFDEVWVFDVVPQVAPTGEVSLVAPARLDIDGASDDLRTWLSGSGSRLGLGNGYGLNFVGTDPDLASRLGLIDGPSD